MRPAQGGMSDRRGRPITGRVERAITSPSVVAASTQNGEEHEDDDEHPQQWTYGDASHQRQDDENDKQNDDQIHGYNPIPKSRHGIRGAYWGSGAYPVCSVIARLGL